MTYALGCDGNRKIELLILLECWDYPYSALIALNARQSRFSLSLAAQLLRHNKGARSDCESARAGALLFRNILFR